MRFIRSSLACASIVSASAFILAVAPRELTDAPDAPQSAPADAPRITEFLPHMHNLDPAKAGAAMTQALTPGKPHEFLAKLAGEWEGEFGIFAAGPGAPPAKSKSSITSRMILGGRFLEQLISGEMIGQPFETLGHIGFSNQRHMFVGSWMSTSDTDITPASGSLDREGKVLTLIALTNEPALAEAGKPVKFVWRVEGDDRFTFEAWEIIHGDPFKVVEANYARKK